MINEYKGVCFDDHGQGLEPHLRRDECEARETERREHEVAVAEQDGAGS